MNPTLLLSIDSDGSDSDGSQGTRPLRILANQAPSQARFAAERGTSKHGFLPFCQRSVWQKELGKGGQNSAQID